MASALVTGGAVRVGREIVLELARAGFDVVVHANTSREAAEDVAREVQRLSRRAYVECVDLAAAEGPETLARRVQSRFDSLDVLVHNAAAYEHAAFEDIRPASFDRMIAVNVRAPFFLTQGLLPTLRASARACVVNVTDAALKRPYSTSHAFAHYLASKAALEQLTRAWAVELAPKIRVNAVAPGPVAIGKETSTAERAALLERTPLRREGSVDDVAKAVLYLATAPFVTGHVLAVDGGMGAA